MLKLHHRNLGVLGLIASLALPVSLPTIAFADNLDPSGQGRDFASFKQSTEQTRLDINGIQTAIRKKQARWAAKETPLSGLTQEGKRRALGLLPPPTSTTPYINKTLVEPILGSPALPTKLDWRNYNGHSYVTPIKNQGACGSCWAFATTAALESKALITLNSPDSNLDLSEQIVLSCSQAGSCNGGWPDLASKFLTATGTAGESYYAYTARDGNCSTATAGWKNNSYKIKDWQYVARSTTPTVDMLKNALYNSGPLSTTMMVYDDFYSYSNGVYTYTTGNFVGAHAVLMVGWDDVDQAFIIKNSWGTGWGENGYVKIGYSELSSVVQLANQTTLAYGEAIPPSFHCQYSLSKTTDTVSAQGTSGVVSVTNVDCDWTASSNANWITITSGNKGHGNGTIAYSVAANPNQTARTGTLTIANQTFTVTQAGASNTVPVCTLTAMPSTITLGESSTLAVNCNPAATSYTWTQSGFGKTTAKGTVSPTSTTVYSVVGNNGMGDGNVATATVTVTSGKPVTPTSLLTPVGAIESTMPSFSWGAVSSATDYYLFIRDLSTGTTVVNSHYFAKDLGCASGTGTCATPFPPVRLTAGRNYAWYVLARNQAGDSPWSAPKSFSINMPKRKK